jgi:hypothetical protein
MFAGIVIASLVGIAIATATLETTRHVRLKVLARLAFDAELHLPYDSAEEFMEKAP